MLHAWRLAFNHPNGGRRVALQSPIPPEYTPWLIDTELPEWDEAPHLCNA
jgi:23S rRNA pseudouridine1911/1915/1917 synthase